MWRMVNGGGTIPPLKGEGPPEGRGWGHDLTKHPEPRGPAGASIQNEGASRCNPGLAQGTNRTDQSKQYLTDNPTPTPTRKKRGVVAPRPGMNRYEELSQPSQDTSGP